MECKLLKVSYEDSSTVHNIQTIKPSMDFVICKESLKISKKMFDALIIVQTTRYNDSRGCPTLSTEWEF